MSLFKGNEACLTVNNRRYTVDGYNEFTSKVVEILGQFGANVTLFVGVIICTLLFPVATSTGARHASQLYVTNVEWEIS